MVFAVYWAQEADRRGAPLRTGVRAGDGMTGLHQSNSDGRREDGGLFSQTEHVASKARVTLQGPSLICEMHTNAKVKMFAVWSMQPKFASLASSRLPLPQRRSSEGRYDHCG